MKKFASVSMKKGNPKWEDSISRENAIYKRTNDIRSEFNRDYTRILHSNGYCRLKHKTQVFFAAENDHVCTRIEHVQHVMSVSYTIAKYLGLNEDLVMAIAIGHDIGHAPFGHEGEKAIKEILGNSSFWHEKNGLYVVDNLETLEDSKGQFQHLNLTYAVRDGIVSHCGEVKTGVPVKPRNKKLKLENITTAGKYQPYTWEGCLVKIADKLSYLGRDIDDAWNLSIISPKELVKLKQSIFTILGSTNTAFNKINNTILTHEFISDLCNNSSPEKGLCFSKDLLEIVEIIKDFNYKFIYKHPRVEQYKKYVNLVIKTIYNTLYGLYDKENTPKNIDSISNKELPLLTSFKVFLHMHSIQRNNENHRLIHVKNIYKGIYLNEDTYKKACIDYIAGMSDKFALSVFNEIIKFK